jgi:hypothetical protein
MVGFEVTSGRWDWTLKGSLGLDSTNGRTPSEKKAPRRWLRNTALVHWWSINKTRKKEQLQEQDHPMHVSRSFLCGQLHHSRSHAWLPAQLMADLFLILFRIRFLQQHNWSACSCKCWKLKNRPCMLLCHQYHKMMLIDLVVFAVDNNMTFLVFEQRLYRISWISSKMIDVDRPDYQWSYLKAGRLIPWELEKCPSAKHNRYST